MPSCSVVQKGSLPLRFRCSRLVAPLEYQKCCCCDYLRLPQSSLVGWWCNLAGLQKYIARHWKNSWHNMLSLKRNIPSCPSIDLSPAHHLVYLPVVSSHGGNHWFHEFLLQTNTRRFLFGKRDSCFNPIRANSNTSPAWNKPLWGFLISGEVLP